MSNFHLHLMVDATFKATPKENDIQFVTDWCNRLIKKIDMETFIPPIVKYDNTEGNEGLSFLLALTTSHSSGHFWKTFGKFDLYSCREYKLKDFIEMLEEFNPIYINYMLVDRSNSEFEIKKTGLIHY